MARISDTKSLRLLLNRFGKSCEALSVVSLIEEFKGQMNRTTVYRILSRLEDIGTLRSFSGHGGLKWYTINQTKPDLVPETVYPHFQCSLCGKTERLSNDIEIPEITNYKVRTASFLILGNCHECNHEVI